jgi:hypothetical protein
MDDKIVSLSVSLGSIRRQKSAPLHASASVAANRHRSLSDEFIMFATPIDAKRKYDNTTNRPLHDLRRPSADAPRPSSVGREASCTTRYADSGLLPLVRERSLAARPMAGCDSQAVPGGRAERRASAARPSHRLLENSLCTRLVNDTGATFHPGRAQAPFVSPHSQTTSPSGNED